MNKNPVYKRILLKIGGEALAGPDGLGIDPIRAENLAEHLQSVCDLGVEIAIVIGAGHNGLTNAAFLAKAGLDVLVLEKNAYIGGATLSRELHKDWKYSN